MVKVCMLTVETNQPSDYIPCGNVVIKADGLQFSCIISSLAHLWGISG